MSTSPGPATSAGITHVGVGAQFGADARYTLLRLVGTGGMASVWVAGDARSGGEVAVKILSDALAFDPAFVVRFEREARLAAQLEHPNVVRVLDHNAEGGRPYLVMEHVPGGTLADRLRAGRLDRWELHDLALDLLLTLAYLHGAGVLHRDLKPANVLLDAERRLRLTDFGIAHLAGATRITGTGELIGTQQYLSPEVLAGESAGVGSDLYACGVLLGECAGEDAPAPLRNLIARLTASEPERRPASAAAALSILTAEPGSAPAEAPPAVLAQPSAASAAKPSAASAAQPTAAQPTAASSAQSPAAGAGPAPEPARPTSWLEPQPAADFPPVLVPVAPHLAPAQDAAPSDFPPAAFLPSPADPPIGTGPAAYPDAPESSVPVPAPRRRPARRFVVAALVVPLVLATAAFGVVANGDDGDSAPPIPAPVDGTLTQQLDGLDRAIDLARK